MIFAKKKKILAWCDDPPEDPVISIFAGCLANHDRAHSHYDINLRQWKEGTWTKTIRNAARRGAAESLMEERLQTGANKWRKGLFEERKEAQYG